MIYLFAEDCTNSGNHHYSSHSRKFFNNNVPWNLALLLVSICAILSHLVRPWEGGTLTLRFALYWFVPATVWTWVGAEVADSRPSSSCRLFFSLDLNQMLFFASAELLTASFVWRPAIIPAIIAVFGEEATYQWRKTGQDKTPSRRLVILLYSMMGVALTGFMALVRIHARCAGFFRTEMCMQDAFLSSLR